MPVPARVPPALVLALLALRSAPPVLAATYVVDAGGTGNFLDLPPAVAASQDGDVLLVLPGAYSSFTLDKSLIVVGYGDPTVGGGIAVANLASPLPAAIVGLRPLGLSVSNCASPVLLQELGTIPTGVVVVASDDVRWSRTSAVAGAGSAVGTPAVAVELARLEVVDATLQGADGPFCDCPNDGGDGLEARAGARVHLAGASASGGHGGGTSSLPGGDGGHGVHVLASALAILAGDGSSAYAGGGGGIVLNAQNCFFDGYPGSGARNDGGKLRVSGAQFSGLCCIPNLHCVPQIPSAPISGPYASASPIDPTLRLVGTPAAGQAIQLVVHGEPGSAAVLYFGRQAIVATDPTSVVELLTPRARLVPLGTLPASGEATFAWTIPAVLAPGTFLCAQAEVTPAGATLQRTNSVPIVVR